MDRSREVGAWPALSRVWFKPHKRLRVRREGVTRGPVSHVHDDRRQRADFRRRLIRIERRVMSHRLGSCLVAAALVGGVIGGAWISSAGASTSSPHNSALPNNLT